MYLLLHSMRHVLFFNIRLIIWQKGYPDPTAPLGAVGPENTLIAKKIQDVTRVIRV